jgi:hypothetical protein
MSKKKEEKTLETSSELFLKEYWKFIKDPFKDLNLIQEPTNDLKLDKPHLSEMKKIIDIIDNDLGFYKIANAIDKGDEPSDEILENPIQILKTFNNLIYNRNKTDTTNQFMKTVNTERENSSIPLQILGGLLIVLGIGVFAATVYLAPIIIPGMIIAGAIAGVIAGLIALAALEALVVLGGALLIYKFNLPEWVKPLEMLLDIIAENNNISQNIPNTESPPPMGRITTSNALNRTSTNAPHLDSIFAVNKEAIKAINDASKNTNKPKTLQKKTEEVSQFLWKVAKNRFIKTYPHTLEKNEQLRNIVDKLEIELSNEFKDEGESPKKLQTLTWFYKDLVNVPFSESIKFFDQTVNPKLPDYNEHRKYICEHLGIKGDLFAKLYINKITSKDIKPEISPENVTTDTISQAPQ